ncbi:hypothetical protein [Acidithiobacillus ferrivorans]|nr:hypothetical protein [Acidithiobacillus ferrivorans]
MMTTVSSMAADQEEAMHPDMPDDDGPTALADSLSTLQSLPDDRRGDFKTLAAYAPVHVALDFQKRWRLARAVPSGGSAAARRVAQSEGDALLILQQVEQMRQPEITRMIEKALQLQPEAGA